MEVGGQQKYHIGYEIPLLGHQIASLAYSKHLHVDNSTANLQLKSSSAQSWVCRVVLDLGWPLALGR